VILSTFTTKAKVLFRTVRGQAPDSSPPTGGERRIAPLATLHDFWRQESPEGNDPRTYINHLGRSKALLELISDVPRDARVLEIGCNVGRNLAYLVDNGYENVEGVEINPHAVELLRETYPQLAYATVHVGAAGGVLPGIPSDSFDLVFTMAVIEHIHPDEANVFDELIRIGHQILTIEPRRTDSQRSYPWNVTRLFTSRGMVHVSRRPMSEFPSVARDWRMRAFVANRFRRPTPSDQG
jgi:SAM-dependent methyltransferase